MPLNNLAPRATLDVSRFPVVVATEIGTLPDRERTLWMEDLEGLLERRGRHALVMDLTRGAQVPRDQRVYIADAFGMHTQLIVAKWAGIAVVVRSPVLHHMSVAAFWLKIAPVPARMFPSVDAATAWARGCLSLVSTGEIPIVDDAQANPAKSG